MFGGLTRLGSLRAATDRPENMRQARDAPRRILIASRSKNRHASQFRECFDRTFLGKRPSLWLTDATLDDRLPDLFDLPWFIGHLLHWQLKMLLYSVTLYFHKLLNENFLHNLEYISSWKFDQPLMYHPWREKIFTKRVYIYIEENFKYFVLLEIFQIF